MASGKPRKAVGNDIGFEQFRRDRADFISKYSNRKATDTVFASIGSESTIYRLLRTALKTDEDFNPKTWLSLHEFLYPPPESLSLYDQLAKSFKQSDGDKDNIEPFFGKYFVFRFAPTKNGPRYRRGEIELLPSPKSGDPIFHHWSWDYDKTKHTGSEHTGFVFHHAAKLYFAGRRKGVMRLGIIKTEDEDKVELCMAGLVLSVSTQQKEPFAAKLLLVPVENTTLVNELDPDGPNGSGEARFLELVETLGPDQAFLSVNLIKS